MKEVLYTCPFIPAEWIAAHGLRPRRILPGSQVDACLSGTHRGLCTFVRAFMSEVCAAPGAEVPRPAAVIMTTVCDQMRRAAELVTRDSGLPVFLLTVPSTWQTVAARRLYMGELERLGRFLVRHGGQAPSPDQLAGVMLHYEEERARLREARGSLSARHYAELTADFHRTGLADPGRYPVTPPARGPALALVGESLLPRQFELFDLVEAAGATVALDATGSGERTLPNPFNRRTLKESPFLTLVDAYFEALPDAARRPNSRLYEWLKSKMAQRGICGIIFRRSLNCDLWNAEAQRLKEWASVPTLVLDLGDGDRLSAHAVSRIQAFLEMVS
jgi:benzoyl-CoA reductase/2-hydroxyglutaryl-CoA dehydratase subunit BcrC/BadD/HgdB